MTRAEHISQLREDAATFRALAYEHRRIGNYNSANYSLQDAERMETRAERLEQGGWWERTWRKGQREAKSPHPQRGAEVSKKKFTARQKLRNATQGQELACYWCGKPLVWKEDLPPEILEGTHHPKAFQALKGMKVWLATTEHLVPRADGGSNALTNLVPACHPCNTGREAKEVRLVCRKCGLPKKKDSMRDCESCRVNVPRIAAGFWRKGLEPKREHFGKKVWLYWDVRLALRAWADGG